MGAGDVRALRDGVRVLPGALRRDARRDHRLLRRAHPADDLAGRDPGLHDHAQRCERPRDPGRARRTRGLPGDGRGIVVLLVVGVVGAYVGTRSAPSAASRPVREPARAAADRGTGPRLPAAADHVRDAGAGHRRDARRGGLRVPMGAGRQVRRHDPVRLLRRDRRSADTRPGARWASGRQEEGVRRRLPRAGPGALLLVSSRSAPYGGSTARPRVGVGYAGAQVFPMAMLPDAAAVDARRTGRTAPASTPASGRRGRRSGWRSGRRSTRWCSPSAATARPATSTPAGPARVQPGSAMTAIVLGFSLIPAC